MHFALASPAAARPVALRVGPSRAAVAGALSWSSRAAALQQATHGRAPNYMSILYFALLLRS